MEQELTKKFSGDCFTTVKQSFTGSFSRIAELVPTQSPSRLVAVLTGESKVHPILMLPLIGKLTKIGNIVINSAMGLISNVIKQYMNYALPVYLEDIVENILLTNNVNNLTVLLAQARFDLKF